MENYELIQSGNSFLFPTGQLMIQQYSSGVPLHIQYDGSYEGFVISWRYSLTVGMEETHPLEYHHADKTLILPYSMFETLNRNKVVFFQGKAVKDGYIIQTNVVKIKIKESLEDGQIVSPDHPDDITLITEIVVQHFEADIIPRIDKMTEQAVEAMESAKNSASEAKKTLQDVNDAGVEKVNIINETAIREKSAFVETATNETRKSCVAIEAYKNGKEAELQQHVNEWKSEIDVQGNTIIENASNVLNQTKEQARNAQTSATASALSATASDTSSKLATTKASEASTSAVNAKTSETNANTAMLASQQAERNSKTNETNASNSATASAKSATASDASSKLATTKANEALASANNAKVSEDNSLKHANDAQTTADTVKSEAELMQYNADHVDMVEKWSYNLSSTHKVEGHVVSVNNSADYYLRDLKLCGQTEQFKTTGAQLYNVNGEKYKVNEAFKISEDGWISLDYDNTQSQYAKFFEYYLAPSNVITVNTEYSLIIEIQSITNVMLINTATDAEGYLSQFSYKLTNDSTSGTKIYKLTTIQDFTSSEYMLQTKVLGMSNKKCNIKFRISLLKNLNVTPETFKYELYTGGKASPSSEYQQPLIERQVKEITFSNKNLFYFDDIPLVRYNVNYSVTDQILSFIPYDVNDPNIGKAVIRGSAYLPSYGVKIKIDNRKKLFLSLSNKSFNKNFVSIFDKNGISLDYKSISSNVGEIDLSAYPTADFIMLRIGIQVAELKEYKTTVQIEYGDKATNYVKHQEQKLALPEPIILRGMPVTSGGNVTIDGQQYVSDTIENVDGEISYVQRIGVANKKFSDLMKFKELQNTNVYSTENNHKMLGGSKYSAFCDVSIWKYSFNDDDNHFYWDDPGQNKQSVLFYIEKDAVVNNINYTGILVEPIITPLPIDVQRKWRSLTSFDPSTTIQNDGNVYQIVEYADNVQEASAILEETKRLASETVTSSGLSSASALQAHEDMLKASASETKANEYWNNAKAEAFNANKSATSALESKNVSQTNADLIIDSADQITKNMQNIEYMKELGFSLGMLNSASGHIISVGDSAKYFLKNFRMYGETNQNTTTGAQLLEYPYYHGNRVDGPITYISNPDGSITIKSSVAPGAGRTFRFKEINTLKLEPGEYTLSSINMSAGMRFTLGGGTSGMPEQMGYSITFTVTEDNTSVGDISFGVFGGNVINTTIYPMLNKGSVALPWEPYTQCKPTPNPLTQQLLIEKTISEIMIHGNQLFDASKISSKMQGGASVTNNGDGSFIVSGSGNLTESMNNSAIINKENTLKILKSGELKLKAEKITNPYSYMALCTTENGKEKALAEVNNLSNTSIIRTIQDDWLKNEVLYIRFGFYGVKEQPITPGTIKPIIYQDGDGAWEPYKEQKITLSAPIALRGLPIAGGGNVTIDGQQYISDTIEVVDGQVGIARKNNKFVLNGSEEWVYEENADIENNNVFRYRTGAAKAKNCLFCICNLFICHTTYTKKPSADMCSIVVGSGILEFRCNPDTAIIPKGDVEAFKTFLSNNNLEFTTRLAETFDLLPEADQKAIKSLMSHNPSTVISNDASAYMTTEYVIDSKGYIDKKIGELSATMLAKI